MKPERRFRIWMAVAGLFFFALLAVLFTRPLAFHAGSKTVDDISDPPFQAWTLAWDARALQHDPLNLFNANIFYPNDSTLAYSDHQVTNGILAMPILWAGGSPVLAHNILLILSFFACSLAAYLLAFHLSGSRAGALAAGIAYAYAPYRLAHVMHLNLLSAAFIPLTLLFMHRYCEKRRAADAFLAALFFALQALSTWHYGIMLSIAILVFLAVRLAYARREFTVRWLAVLAVAFLCALVLVYPFARPYLKLQKEPGFTRTLELVEFYQADLKDFLIAPGTNLVWGGISAPLRRNAEIPGERAGEAERSLFPGLVVLLLAAGGAVHLFRKGRGEERFAAWFYVLLAAFSFVLCFGGSLYVFNHKLAVPTPYRLLFYIYPGFKGMRVPTRFGVMIALSLAVLAAFGIKALFEWLLLKKGRKPAAAAVLLVLALLLLDLMSTGIPLQNMKNRENAPAVYRWLAGEEGDAPTVELPILPVPEGIKPLLRQESMRTYYSAFHWKKILNGYSGFMPESFFKASELYRDFPSREAVDYFRELGIRYMVLHGGEIDDAHLEVILGWLEEQDDVTQVAAFGDDLVFELEPG